MIHVLRGDDMIEAGRDVCMSVPSVVNRTGVLRVLPVPLSADERKGLHRSAAAVRATIDKLGLGRVAERI